MIDLSKIEAIYLYTKITDMRKGITGLLGLAQGLVEKKDMGNRLFIFCGKDKRNIKILEMDYDGYWLYQKRLVTGNSNGQKAILILLSLIKDSYRGFSGSINVSTNSSSKCALSSKLTNKMLN